MIFRSARGFDIRRTASVFFSRRSLRRKKFVETVQPREVVTFAAVEKSPLPDIDVEEAQEWAKRQPL